MAFSLSSISKKTGLKAPMCLFHGVPGVGKTTFAANAPNCVFIQTEDGLGANEVNAFPLCKSYADVIDAINALGSEEHEFNWLVLDSLSALQELIFNAVCDENNVSSIEKIGYGKGYVFALDKWAELLTYLIALRDHKQMGVLLIAHTEVNTFKNPEGEDYDRYHIDLDKRAMKLMRERTDVIGFFNYKTYVKKQDSEAKKGKGKDGGRFMYLQETPAFIAKNRFNLPAQLAIPSAPENPWQPFADALASAKPNQ